MGKAETEGSVTWRLVLFTVDYVVDHSKPEPRRQHDAGAFVFLHPSGTTQENACVVEQILASTVDVNPQSF